MSCTDALGRMVEVIEYAATNYETDYGYDVLDNLLSVTQKGDNANNARTRTFFYDSLSRLTSAANPESGTITYAYTKTDGTLCAGDLSAVCSKTAPAPNQTTGTGTVTTTYTYDVLNRLTGKSYSDSTPPDAYGYDYSSLLMGTHQLTIYNSIGRLSFSVGGVVAPYGNDAMYAYSYDTMGRVVSFWNGVNNLAAEFDYTYNLDGSPKTLTYPSGRMLTYTVKGAGRITDIKDVANNVNYAAGATYAPPGELATVINGTSSVGITVTDSYNNRLQPSVLQADTNGSGSHTIFSRSYGFQLGTADNGVVYQIVNGLDGNRSQTFTYDNLNRIVTAYTTTGTNWGEAYTTDAWGNLTNIASCCGRTNHETLNAAPASIQNHINGFGYDIAGNVTTNGSATFVYDAHNRLMNTSGYSYGYDANGERVKKSVPTGQPATLYLHGPGGETLAETDASGILLNEYIFFNGQRIARRDASGAVHYYFADHLGSASLITDASGTVQKEADYYPYGGEITISGADANHYKFTGKERDETGLDDFDARYYSSAMGRFMTADWGAIPMAVPYAVLGNPQTLNLYSYVENNPATGTDPDGHADSGSLSAGPGGACSGDTNCSDAKSDRKDADIGRAEAAYQHAIQNANKSSAQKKVDPKKSGTASLSSRAKLGLAAAGNFVVGAGKTLAAAGAGLAAPETGGLTVPLAIYAGIGAAGNFTAAGAQAVGAITGHVEEASQGADAVMAVTTFSGAITLARTGDVSKAASAAAIEGVFTAGFTGGATGNPLGGSNLERVGTVIDFGQNVQQAVAPADHQ
jgi:RHS repeat-associated protein